MEFASSGFERGFIRINDTAWNFPGEDICGKAVLLNEDELAVFGDGEGEGPVGEFEEVESTIFT